MLLKKLVLILNIKDELRISGGKAILVAPSVWGAVRGLDTFSQLTYITNTKQVNHICNLFILKGK